MKFFPKTFENVFSSDAVKDRCKLGDVSTQSGMNNPEYIELFRKTVSDSLLLYFDMAIKTTWLSFQFTYKGYHRSRLFANSLIVDYAFMSFMNNYVGVSNRPITSMPAHSKLMTYVDDLFPEFVEKSPFDNPEYYKFPYEHVTPDFLCVIYQMPERMEILEVAEKSKFTYAEFLDYVINYISSYNEEAGSDIYIFMRPDKMFPYIKYVDNPRYKKGRRKIKIN